MTEEDREELHDAVLSLDRMAMSFGPSQDGSDSIVDAVDGVGWCVRKIADAITPHDAAPGHDAQGGTVSSLTEAAMGLTAAMSSVASAIREVADAIRDKT